MEPRVGETRLATTSTKGSSNLRLDKTTIATRLLWLTIVAIHATCCAFYAAVAAVYHKLPETVVSAHLRAYELTLSMDNFPVVVGFHVICAALHLAYLAEMLCMSARRRKLYFRRRVQDPSIRTNNALVSNAGLLSTQSVLEMRRKVFNAWEYSFGVSGFFGVGGKHFALVFLIREATETLLQSIQAYQLSKYVPRVWLNRLAVVVVTISCWSTPAIQHCLFRYPRLKLTLCLLVDITLDFVATVGVPVALVTQYLQDYDPITTDFKYAKWSDVAWLANANNEFKLLFIQSWVDFGGRALFAITLLVCLDDVKLLAAASKMIPRRHSDSSDGVRVRRDRRMEKVVHTGLILWGCIILGLHFGSAGGRDNSSCLVRVRPWLSAQTACAYMRVDCQQHAGMVGKAAELEATWSDIDAEALTLLVFLSCPDFHMPASIRTFTHLTGVYLCNLTLAEWSDDAALSRHFHPSLRQVTITLVNMTAFGNGSSLPQGLMSPDFPPTLGTLFIGYSGISDLPPNLDEIWPLGINMLLLGNAFTSVPDVLLRMNLVRLSLQFNQIQHLPADIFENPSLKWLEVGWNPIDELPRDAEPSSALLEFSFVSTNVSTLPSWMTSDRFLNQVAVHGSMTPYCDQLRAEQDTESTPSVSRYCDLRAL